MCSAPQALCVCSAAPLCNTNPWVCAELEMGLGNQLLLSASVCSGKTFSSSVCSPSYVSWDDNAPFSRAGFQRCVCSEMSPARGWAALPARSVGIAAGCVWFRCKRPAEFCWHLFTVFRVSSLQTPRPGFVLPLSPLEPVSPPAWCWSGMEWSGIG